MAGEGKKYLRKLARCAKILEKDFPEISAATDLDEYQVIHIGNLGHTTGYDEVSLLECLHVHGAENGITELTLFPGKQYSFVKYANASDALAAHSSLTSKRVQGDDNGLQNLSIYAILVSAIPTREEPAQHSRPPGLAVWEDFISHEEEQSLLHLIDWSIPPADSHHGSSLKNRSVRHYGYEFEYGSNSIDLNKPLRRAPIPGILLSLIDRMMDRGLLQHRPDQVTVNRYLPGQGIPPHTDSHGSCGPELASVSVGGPVVMDWSVDGRLLSQQRKALSHDDNSNYHGDNTLQHALLLPPRSLCIFSGESRYCWQHGIKTRQYDVHKSSSGQLQLIKRQLRISFTFRQTREGPCDCPYHLFCPRHLQQATDLSSGSSSMRAEELETQHVRAVYDNIAMHFSDTRHKPWPNVRQFIESLAPGSWLLDVGCGNGKYLGLNSSLVQMGCDNSTGLLAITQGRGHETVLCSCLALPFKDCCWDAVICIAVLHHLASHERRLAGLEELVRVLRPGGKALVYVWAMEQTRAERKSAYLKKSSSSAASAAAASAAAASAAAASRVLSSAAAASAAAASRVLSSAAAASRVLSSAAAASAAAASAAAASRVLSSWKTKSKTSDAPGEVFHRFYHTFREGELEQMCRSLSGVQVVRSYYDEGNWCVLPLGPPSPAAPTRRVVSEAHQLCRPRRSKFPTQISRPRWAAAAATAPPSPESLPRAQGSGLPWHSNMNHQ